MTLFVFRSRKMFGGTIFTKVHGAEMARSEIPERITVYA